MIVKKLLGASLIAMVALYSSATAADNEQAPKAKTGKKIQEMGMVSSKTIEYRDSTLVLELSYNQANRLVLPAPITGKVTSKDKNIDITVNEDQAFIKFPPVNEITRLGSGKDAAIIKSNNFYNLSNEATEIYLMADNGKTYSFLLMPAEIPAQTIIIKDNIVQNEEIAVQENATPFNKNMTNLVKHVFAETKLTGYERTDMPHDLIAENEKVKVYTLSKFKGPKYEAFELELENKKNTGVVVEEKSLIGLIDRPTYAISVYYDNSVYEIPPHGKAKALVVVSSKKD